MSERYDHVRYVYTRLRARANAERNAYDVPTAHSKLLDDAADLIANAYHTPDTVDIDTGGRL